MRRICAGGWVLVGLSLLALTGCAHGSKDGTSSAALAPRTPSEAEAKAVAAFYPLTVGNRWTYSVHLLGERSERTVQIREESEGYFLDTAGGRLRADAHGLRDQKRYLLQGPLEVGTAWSNVVSSTSTEHYRIIRVGESCNTPAGEFPECVTVEARNRANPETTLVNRVTFAKGVGIVKVAVSAERSGTEPSRQAELILKSYEVR